LGLELIRLVVDCLTEEIKARRAGDVVAAAPLALRTGKRGGAEDRRQKISFCVCRFRFPYRLASAPSRNLINE